LLTPTPDAADKHGSPDLELQMKKFYEVAWCDWNTGKPNRDKLEKLGLEREAVALWI